MWEVEFFDEFGEWWNRLSAAEQGSVDFTVSLLQEVGPTLKMPHSSGIEMSRHAHMRELRIQPRRAALLLIGGDETGNNRWYEEYVPLAKVKIYPMHKAGRATLGSASVIPPPCVTSSATPVV